MSMEELTMEMRFDPSRQRKVAEELSKLRLCRAEVYTGKFWATVYGRFHGWGVDFEEFENGVGNYTVGIIELDNGQIIEAIPGRIKFLDRGN